MEILMWDFHFDDLQVHHIIIGHDILSKLNVYLCLSNCIMRVNGFTYKGCNTRMKKVSRIYFNYSSYCIKYKIFWNEELW